MILIPLCPCWWTARRMLWRWARGRWPTGTGRTLSATTWSSGTSTPPCSLLWRTLRTGSWRIRHKSPTMGRVTPSARLGVTRPSPRGPGQAAEQRYGVVHGHRLEEPGVGEFDGVDGPGSQLGSSAGDAQPSGPGVGGVDFPFDESLRFQG